MAYSLAMHALKLSRHAPCHLHVLGWYCPKACPRLPSIEREILDVLYTTKRRIASVLLIAHGIENLSVMEENCVMQSQSEDLDKTQHLK